MLLGGAVLYFFALIGASWLGISAVRVTGSVGRRTLLLGLRALAIYYSVATLLSAVLLLLDVVKNGHVTLESLLQMVGGSIVFGVLTASGYLSLGLPIILVSVVLIERMTRIQE